MSNSHARRASLAALLFVFGVTDACTCGTAPPTLEGPNANVATVIIHVQGVVRDGLTGLPLPNAAVSIPAAGDLGDLRADASGFYSVTFEGIGDFFVFVTQPGYAGARHRAVANFGDTVPDTSLNVRVVVDVLMFPLVGELNGIVAGVGTIDAVAGARLIARVEAPYVPYVDTTDIDLEATTGDDGSYRFTDLPAGVPLRLLVPAQDLDDDGDPDFATATVAVGALDVAPITRNILVQQFVEDQVVWTNFDDIESFAVPTEAEFMFVYAAPMSTTPGATTVFLTRAGTRVAVEHTWDAEGLVLTVAPRAPLTTGQTYELEIVATSATNEIVVWGPETFSVGGDQLPGAVTNMELLDDPDTIDFVDPTITVGFDPVDDATAYRVYARNDMGQSDWLEVGEELATSLDPAEPAISFSLPAAFDSVPGAGTPFGFGETLEIVVVAMIGTNEGPFPAEPLSVPDAACPTFQVSRFGDFDNSGSSDPSEVTFDVVAVGGEWIDPANAPTIAFTRYAAPVGYVLDGATFTSSIVDRDTMRLTGFVPADESADLNRYVVDVSQLRDPSGNTACVGSTTVVGLIAEGNTRTVAFDMELADGWTTTSAQWERGTPVGLPASGASGAVWGTNLDGDYDDAAAATFTLSSPTITLPSSVSSVSFSAWYDIGDGDSVEVHWLEDGGNASLVQAYTFSSAFWNTRSLSMSAFAGETGHFEFRLITDGGDPPDVDAGPGNTPTADDGFFLDTFRVSGSWFLP